MSEFNAARALLPHAPVKSPVSYGASKGVLHSDLVTCKHKVGGF